MPPRDPKGAAAIISVTPPHAVAGGRVTLRGHGFPVDPLPEVTIGGAAARVAFASSSRVVVMVPPDCESGTQSVQMAGIASEGATISIGAAWATGLHQVDNPVFDRSGNLFVTYSGPRGQEAPVSIFRVTKGGSREPFASGIVNATSMVIGPDDHLYVSSRFEGAVYRVGADGIAKQVASDLGVACGLAFDAEGWLYVGDRSGTIFRVREGRATAFASLPPSIAAFHLAMSPGGDLVVTAPTLNTYDFVYRIDRYGNTRQDGFPMGRPQGVAFDDSGTLHVVDALAGACGVYRMPADAATPELLVSAAALVGIAFGPQGELVVTSNETAYRFA
jgi:sugar lactone lactonase YvrE